MPRQRIYETNAQRQAAYRARLVERRRQAGSDAAAETIATLEESVMEAQRRAERAEQRAARVEQELRRTLARRTPPSETSGADRRETRPVAGRMTIAQAVEEIARLEAVVDELTWRLAEAETPRPQPAVRGVESGANRSARRRAERNERRKR